MGIFQADLKGGGVLLLKVTVEKQKTYSLIPSFNKMDIRLEQPAFYVLTFTPQRKARCLFKSTKPSQVQLSMCLGCRRYRLKAKGLKTSKNWIWLRYRPGRASPESMPDVS